MGNVVAAWRALGADAVLIAGIWQVLVTGGLPAQVRMASGVVLTGSVLVIYMLDHLWDAWREPESGDLARNAWVRGHGKLFVGLMMGTLALVMCFLFQLPRELVAWGGVLGMGCLSYYGLRLWNPGWSAGRDVFLGLVFAAGVFLPLLVAGNLGGYVWLMGGLVFLLIANARLCIRSKGRQSRRVADWLVFLLLAGALAAFVGSGLREEPFRAAALAGGISAGVLTILAARLHGANLARPADLILWVPAGLVILVW